jgi:hypothetical protein
MSKLGCCAENLHSAHEEDCCEIPETECPPRIAGQLSWRIGRGATPEATISLRNTGKVARNFTFTATPLIGLNPGAASLSLAAGNTHLAPGQSTTVQVKLLSSKALTACQDYRAEIAIKGAWEQAVEVLCHVLPDSFDSATLEQSDSVKERVLHPESYKTELHWKLGRGVTPEAVITLFNQGKANRVFSFLPTAISGVDPSGASLKLTPDSLMLAPGENGSVKLELLDSKTLSPGQRYEADIVLRGFYDRRLQLRADITPDAFDRCEVEQGEAPTHLRAHRWYHHFQCTEPCESA